MIIPSDKERARERRKRNFEKASRRNLIQKAVRSSPRFKTKAHKLKEDTRQKKVTLGNYHEYEG